MQSNGKTRCDCPTCSRSDQGQTWRQKSPLILLFCLLALAAKPAAAGSVFFTPAGSQLDGDSILDIDTLPGSTIVFTIALDPSGVSLSGPFDRFVVDYSLAWDKGELDNGDSHGSISGLASDFKLDGTFLQGPVDYSFTVLNPVNDGSPDFKLTIDHISAHQDASPFTNLDVTNQFSPNSQIVEVQSSPEPGSLALLGIAAFPLLGLIRRRRA